MAFFGLMRREKRLVVGLCSNLGLLERCSRFNDIDAFTPLVSDHKFRPRLFATITSVSVYASTRLYC